MMKKCAGEKCNSTNGLNHSKECRFEHFQSYSGFFDEPEGVQEKIKVAYFHGFEAAEPSPDKTESEHKMPFPSPDLSFLKIRIPK